MDFRLGLEPDSTLLSSSTLAADFGLDAPLDFLVDAGFRFVARRVGRARLFSSAWRTAANRASSSSASVRRFFLSGAVADVNLAWTKPSWLWPLTAAARGSRVGTTSRGEESLGVGSCTAVGNGGLSRGEEGAALASAWNLSNRAMIRALMAV